MRSLWLPPESVDRPRVERFDRQPSHPARATHRVVASDTGGARDALDAERLCELVAQDEGIVDAVIAIWKEREPWPNTTRDI